ncbi:MAG: amino acid ABC transporter substrate-binding protein, partial [Actinobacteria bacterium]|nr:amino acid ABC transporter substrate-binding protein [Actinomycetota bacterium]NIS29227.1 amino acid ABC transporter substrate-binding protein [Actinomycetota bacterium]NIU64620.1 amino acid ABC transporter substrate-binding protein [Actinomycetota bacterium]NIW26411.1 amino acid ABC transporter substrate-binding protein [Actinomycetota bacterium]
MIVDEVTADGATNVAIAARADDYGVALADLVEAGLQDVGASVAARQDYDPNATEFSAEVSAITGEN